jgi:hypothetical protein
MPPAPRALYASDDFGDFKLWYSPSASPSGDNAKFSDDSESETEIRFCGLSRFGSLTFVDMVQSTTSLEA